jgi:integrase
VAESAYRAFLVAYDSATPASQPPPNNCTLPEALLFYREHAGRHYTDSRTINRIDRAIAVAVSSQPLLIINQFRPRHLRAIRADLLNQSPSLSRSYANALIRSLKTAINWLVQEGIAEPAVLHAARSVRALGPGEGGRETGLVPSVADAVIDGTIPACSPVIAAMIVVNRATGMRPGELCGMRRCDISTTPAELIMPANGRSPCSAMPIEGKMIWLYCPATHKNLHRGKIRIIAIGPDGQTALAPLLVSCEPSQHVFRPDLSDARAAALMAGDRYTTRSYHNAICRAVARVNRERKLAMRYGAPIELLPAWSPNQIRHAALEHTANEIDAESAAIQAGHSASRRALDAYVQSVIRRAAETAAKVG